ncbi:MAG: DUF2288 domain-containing protein [Gammaproteobacteria bacterium]|nr:DUF2288 domain-containing protein [Gammaproteobacteria bacterium]
MSEDENELISQLHGETAKLPWHELERHFARGSVIKVEVGMDLLKVAVILTKDDKSSLEKLLADGSVANASVEDASLWHECSTEFWTVVVAPWVLVQPIGNKLDS